MLSALGKNRWGNKISKEESLSKRQKAIIAAIKKQPSLTRDELAKVVGVSLATLKREITILRKAGYIDRGGSNKKGQWTYLK